MAGANTRPTGQHLRNRFGDISATAKSLFRLLPRFPNGAPSDTPSSFVVDDDASWAAALKASESSDLGPDPEPPQRQSPRDKELQAFIDGCWGSWGLATKDSDSLRVCSDCWECFASSLEAKKLPAEISSVTWHEGYIFCNVAKSAPSSHCCSRRGKQKTKTFYHPTEDEKQTREIGVGASNQGR
jgi:hypothetical protein